MCFKGERITKKEEIENLLRWWIIPKWLHTKEKKGKEFTKQEAREIMVRIPRLTVKGITNKIFEIIER